MIDTLETISEYAKNRFKKNPPYWLNFWEQLHNYGTDSCWEWKHRKNAKGYGTIKVMGKSILAHRFSWQISNGEVKDSECICHKCDNPICCNPNHLFKGSRAENNQDKMSKGRHKAPKGELHHKAKFTEIEVKQMRELFDSGVPYRKIATQYGGAEQTIYSIVSRSSWNHIK